MRFIKLLIFISGCTTLATYQTPITTPKDEVSFGASVSGFIVVSDGEVLGLPLTVPSFYLRYGLADNQDIGFSFLGLPVFGSTVIDYKYQFLNNGLLGAFNLGSGFWFLPGDYFDIKNPLLLYPFIGFSFGNERVYFGTRVYYFNSSSYSYILKKRITTETFSGSLILGATLGKGSFKFAPEINFTIPLSPIREDIVLPVQDFAFTYGFGFIYIPQK